MALVLREMAVDGNGNTYLAGFASGFALARLKSEGSFDESFGVGGVVTGNAGVDADTLIVLNNGNILLAGYSGGAGNMPVTLAEYDPQGNLVSSFGSNGVLNLSFYPNNVGMSLYELANGKILLSGVTNNSGYFFSGDPTGIGIAVLNSDGSLDTSFGNSGKVILGDNVLPWWTFATPQQVGGVEKILVAGTKVIDGQSDMFISRLNLDGSLDTSFGTSGEVVIHNVKNEQATNLLVNNQGEIFLTGSSSDTMQFFDLPYPVASSSNFILTKLNANGIIDTSFGLNGIVETDFGSKELSLASTLQEDGKIVMAGQKYPNGEYWGNASSLNLVLSRYTSDGNLDSTFGNTGRVAVAIDMTGMQWFEVTDAFVDPNGQIFIAWTSGNTSSTFKFDSAGVLLNGRMIGTDGSEQIVATDVSDTLTGLDGNDQLFGGAGNDTINGGAGNDTINGGAGVDTADFSGTTTGVVVNLTAGTATGDGTDTLTGVENAVGGAGNDTLTANNTTGSELDGGAGSDSLNGGAAADVLYGGDGNDIVNAGAGNDLIIGGDGAGDDAYNGGDGIDTVKYTSALAGITVDLSTSTGTATSTAGNDASHIGNDTLTGIENIIAGNFNDILTGSTLDNAFTGESGNDTINGGTGNDTAIYQGTKSQYTITNNNNGTWTVADTVVGRDGTDTISNIEYLQFTDQTYSLTTVAPLTRIGTAKADTLTGGAGNDILIGLGGTDVMNGLENSDLYAISSATEHTAAEINDTGTSGIDEVRFTTTTASTLTLYALDRGIELVTIGTGTAASAITTGTTANNINAAAVANALSITGNNGNNTLTGTAYGDILTGNGGVDTFNITAGTDTITDLANGGAEIFNVSAGATVNATVAAAWTATTATVNNGTANLFTNGYGVNLAAATGSYGFNVTNNSITGTTLKGSAKADTLTGGIGNDTLNGGLGNDTLIGGAGTDIAQFASSQSSYTFTTIGDNGLQVAGAQGTDLCVGIETLTFADATVKLQLMRAGAEFQVNTYTSNDQWLPSVTALNDGGWVVTWNSVGQDGSGLGVYGQRYSADGTSAGPEFQVNATTVSNQLYSSVTALTDGGWIVTWSGQDGDGYGIYAQRYSVAGALLGSEFRVNAVTLNNQNSSSVAALADGGWIVTWDSGSQDGNGNGIYGQRYSAEGTSVGAEFQVNTYTSNDQWLPSVTALNDGGWAVTWNSYGQDTSDTGVYGQRYSADGTSVGAEFQVNSTTAFYQTSPSVTALRDGGWLVNWMSSFQDGDGFGIYGQRYSLSGAKAGQEFLVNTYKASEQSYPSVTALADGGWVVIWESYGQDGSEFGIYGQRYLVTGSAQGVEFQVNSFTMDQQADPSVSALEDGGWLVTWNSYGQDGYDYGIFSQRYNASGEIVSSGINLNITGSMAAQTLVGGTGNDTISGLDGNDTLNGGAGADTMVGGLGNDTFVVDNAWDVITENAGEGTDVVQANVSYTLSDNIENLTLTGSSAINGTGNTLANTLTGNRGNNLIDGGAGADTMVGGAGDDTYYLDSTGDKVTEVASAGNDLIVTSLATYSIASVSNLENLTYTGNSNTTLTGNTLNNTITGSSGNDILNGGAGADNMIGGTGDDSYVVDNIGDTVTEYLDQGIDTVQSSVTSTISSFIENLTLTGTSAISGTGNTLDNILTGNSGVNTLNGGVGSDTLIGGNGNDTLTGGAGYDYFVFNAATNASINKDTITDFSHADDTIKLSKAIFTAFSAQGIDTTLLSGQFWANTTGLAHDADDRIIYNTSTGGLFYDSNGSTSGGAVQIALIGTITHPGDINYTDFVIV